jgi:hypothetical protein
LAHASPEKGRKKKMSEWVLHCEVNQCHMRRSQPPYCLDLE